jgi:hypothetical protein
MSRVARDRRLEQITYWKKTVIDVTGLILMVLMAVCFVMEELSLVIHRIAHLW